LGDVAEDRFERGVVEFGFPPDLFPDRFHQFDVEAGVAPLFALLERGIRDVGADGQRFAAARFFFAAAFRRRAAAFGGFFGRGRFRGRATASTASRGDERQGPHKQYRHQGGQPRLAEQTFLRSTNCWNGASVHPIWGDASIQSAEKPRYTF
jgi:hypothetical protein